MLMGPEVDNVLSGTFDFPFDASEATKDFLMACTKVNNLPEPYTPNVRKSFYEYIQAWNMRKE